MKKDLQQLFNEYLYECEFVRKARPITLHGYRQSFLTFTRLSPIASPSELSPTVIVLFFKNLQERKRIVGKGSVKIGIKKSTVATYWTRLNTFFSWLEARGCIVNNPFKAMEYPAPTYEDKKFLKKEDVEKILAAVYTHFDKNIILLKRNLAMFYVLIFCGLRREELLLLQIRDVDFERKAITIRAETSKSNRQRVLPLHSSVMIFLRDYLKERKDLTTPYLFASTIRDDRLSDIGFKHLLTRIKVHSKVKFHPHQFRHTFAVNFLKSSNNIAKLRQLLGHKDIRMTMAYLRCLPTDEIRGDVESMSIDEFI